MKKTIQFLSLLTIGATLFTSCKKDPVVEDNDNEVITTMQLRFVPLGGGTTVTYAYDDADGPGGAAPTKQTITLAPNKSYNVTLTLLNKTANPITDITTDINGAEAIAHRFYFASTANSNITISSLNNDPNGVELGTSSTWSTGAIATGKTTVTLRHYGGNPPGKAITDLVSSTKSSTDIEVQFDTVIQ